MRVKLFKIILIVFLSAFLLYALFLICVAATGYRPKGVEALAIKEGNETTGKLEREGMQELIRKETEMSVATFNIGYCGLDREQDFFMDGGKNSRSGSREQTLANLENITDILVHEGLSFAFLQEVDIKSTRSFHVNQKDFINKKLSGYSSVFAANYKVLWVPVPLSKPMGSVYSGLITLSRYSPRSAARYQYPGSEKWPRRMFDLERCFIECRLPVEDGGELVLINSHLSAFDEGGLIRQEQLAFLKEYIIEEYRDKGNYVIVGGDWNHVLPGTDPGLFVSVEEKPFWVQEIPGNFTPEGFIWAVDGGVPTVRSTASPYREKYSYLAVIDGFLVSPNVEVKKVYGHDLNFKNSDHNPVSLIFSLSVVGEEAEYS
ncbi:endonuclease/exonuclease/phosphatase family protein [Pelotomaculum propionicicum]|uniref:endonuclease/exonuclease/phosphatase family protein n=1 Tax=Pelotomaculum propionicicum TaxID=258475 RepID=UPI003B7A855B